LIIRQRSTLYQDCLDTGLSSEEQWTGARIEICRHQASAEVAWRECSKAVDQLEAGKPYRLHRWEFPDDHPERMVGSINDVLLLTAGDELA
jgi:hypothetical protein